MEDMSKVPAAVRSMRNLLDKDFVAYLGYAIDKERAVGALSDRDKKPTQRLTHPTLSIPSPVDRGLELGPRSRAFKLVAGAWARAARRLR